MVNVLFALLYKFSVFLLCNRFTVSSVKHIISVSTIIFNNPFIYNINNIGPSPVPCSTPWLTIRDRLSLLLIFTIWCLSLRYELIKLFAVPLIPAKINYLSENIWFTQSKDYLMSKNIPIGNFFTFI